ncbi:ComF family protein [Paracoccus suum]|uniref:ComF family protein n=1 Tax=Paracoccus suum TaxID=2259340 RepID=A0A344PGM8_9RHOB|nr:ComF family protein [Paracoccus suum]AXC48533.1 ComF family protein [Paracoccus suum]
MGLNASGLARIWEGTLGLVYPPQCPGCDAPVGEAGSLCPDCWREARFITGAACLSCGAPMASDGGASGAGAWDGQCDECLALARPWTRGVAALTYAGTARRLVLMLKHGDRPDLAPTLGRWLAAAAAPVVVPGTVVVPVPVHPARALRRRYNQAALIGRAAARALGVAHQAGALRRLRNTPMQDHRSVADRFANQSGAIEVAARAAPALVGQPVLLVDDVMASGATLGAASEALIAAGAGAVTIAVVARAVKDT